MNTAHTPCPRCGEPLDRDSLLGLCPRCTAASFFAEELHEDPVDDDDARPVAGGERMGDYEIFEVIARGGMGVVYRARQVSLNREVAVKMILSGVLAGDEAVARFKTEAAAAAGLRHPHIIAIHEIGEEDGMHFFSMEYVAGKSLSAQLSEGPLPARRAAEIMEKVAGAVAYAHERGVVHRDLKPSNVLLDTAGEPRVTDFGLAKKMSGASDLTMSGQILGTPGYLAPEQARGQSHRAGPPVDIYGLGAILYHLLTGRPPFVGVDLIAVLRQVEGSDPPSLRLLNPSVPLELEAVTLKCLAREPERRYARATEVAEEMRRWLDGRPVLAKPMGPIGKTIRWLRRNPGPAAAVTAIFVLLASVAVISTLAARRLEKSRNSEAAGRRELRRTLYATGLRVAQQLRDEGALGNVAEWVDAQTPAPGEEDLRTFEWRLVRTWTRGDQDSLLDLSPPSEGGALSACGRFATNSGGGTTVLHDLRNGREVGSWHQADGEFGGRRHLTATPDGQMIATTSTTCVHLWDMAAGQDRVLADWPAEAAAFSPDGRWLAVSTFAPRPGDNPRGVIFYDVATWQEMGVVPGRVAGFTWQGEQLEMLNLASGQLEWWSPGAAQAAHTVALSPKPEMWATACFSADGDRVAAVRDSEHLEVYEVGTGSAVAEFPGVFSVISLPRLSPDGRWLARGGAEEEIRLYDLQQPAAAPRLLRGHRSRIHNLRFSDDGRQIVSFSADGTLRTWSTEIADPRPLVPLKPHTASRIAPVFSPDGSWLACTDAFDNTNFGTSVHTVIYDRVTRRPMAGADVLPLGATADGRSLIALRAGQFVAWLDARTGASTREAALPEVIQSRLPNLSPDARYIVCWTAPARGVIYDLVAHQPFMELREGTAYAKFSPDGKLLAIMSSGPGLRVLDLTTREERPPIPSTPFEMVWSADSRRLAFIYTSNPPSLAVADVASMKIEGLLKGQGLPNMMLAFAPDSRTLVSNTRDGTLRFWNLATWSRTLVLPPDGGIGSMTFTPEGDALIVSRNGGYWEIAAPFAPGER